jgi:uncharacterized surface protein with fasciclin (FAS1) repeats
MKNIIQKYFITLLLVGFSSLIMTSCYKQEQFSNPTPQTRSAMAVIENLSPKFNTRVLFGYTYDIFKTALYKTGLDVQLRDGNKTFTIFVADDFAFNQLPAPFNSATAINNLSPTTDAARIAYLKTIMQNHIIEGRISGADFGVAKTAEIAGGVKTQAGGTNGFLVLKAGVGTEGKLDYVFPSANGVPLLSKDNVCSNGLVHIANAVMLPETMYSYIVAEYSAGVPVDTRYTRLKTAIGRFADLQSYLSTTSSNATFFTPSATAFSGASIAGLPLNTDVNILAADPVALRRRLDYHILAPSVGRIPALTGAAGTSVFYLTRYPNRSVNVSFVTITSTGLGLQGFANTRLDRAGNNPNAVVTNGTVGINFYGDYLLDTTGFLATVNGVIYNADTLLDPTP